MDDTSIYTPPKVWTWNKASGGRFANINRPVAGATHEKELPLRNGPGGPEERRAAQIGRAHV